MSKIYVIGYYNHDNIGDEQYKLSFEYVFQSFTKVKIDSLEFVDCDKIGGVAIEDNDIIVLGGGDIMNDYFLDKINAKFSNKPNKILAVSVGVPYAGILINTQKLSIIDYLFIRTQQDKELLSQYFLPERILFFPDISYLLTKYEQRVAAPFKRISGYLDYLTEKQILNNTDYQTRFSKIKERVMAFQKSGKRVVALSLNRHIYSPKYLDEYKKIVGKLGEIISGLITNDFPVVLLPFNTSNRITEKEKNMENDLFIHEDVMKEVGNRVSNQTRLLSRIIVVDTTLDVRDMLSLYDYFYLSIPMRFHACLFSTFKKVPMMPIFTTQKIYNLMMDFSWDYFYEMDKNSKDIPTDMDTSKVFQMFQMLITPNLYNQSKQKLGIIGTEFFAKGLQNGLEKLEGKIGESYLKVKTMGFKNINDTRIEEAYGKVSRYAESMGISDFRLLKDKDIRWNAVCMASYYLTKNVDSVYNHGLMEKMFQTTLKENGEEVPTFQYRNEWLWILKDRQLRVYSERKEASAITDYSIGQNQIEKKGYFYLNYLEQEDYSNVHRSGWQYVFEKIQPLQSDKSNLLMDLYLDKTFHWKKEIYHLLEIIPYRQPWVGFVHHTMDDEFSIYNVQNMVRNIDFVDSLPYCKGLFVLSKTLKAKMEQYLQKTVLNSIPKIYAFVHPTELENIPNFNMNLFLANKDKKLIHIGGWLRNIFSFYFLKLPETCKYKSVTSSYRGLWNLFNKTTLNLSYNQTHTIRKVAIKGNNMNNYFPEDVFLDKMRLALSVRSEKVVEELLNNCIQNCSQNYVPNCSQNVLEITHNWNKHLYDFLSSLDKNLEIIEHLENDKYDQLLTENIVCIHLTDASAVNTLIECIVRNTPIIVNRHPAVVELLGTGYPLYYGDKEGVVGNLVKMNMEIEYLLIDLKNIETAHEYLKKLNKTPFKVETFIKQLIQVVSSLP